MYIWEASGVCVCACSFRVPGILGAHVCTAIKKESNISNKKYPFCVIFKSFFSAESLVVQGHSGAARICFGTMGSR